MGDDFHTMGKSTTNAYLTLFIKELGTEFIDEWCNRHKVDILNVTFLSMVVAENFFDGQDDVDDDTKIALSKDLNPVVLKVLEENDFITHEQRIALQQDITDKEEMISQFFPIALEMSKIEINNKKSNDQDGDDSKDSKDSKGSKKESKKAERDAKKADQKAAKLAKAMDKETKKDEKKRSRAMKKAGKIMAALTKSDTVDDSTDASGDDTESDGTDDVSAEDKIVHLAEKLGLDPNSPVLAAILARSASDKSDESGSAVTADVTTA